ncbi:prephenate dehydrogenase [Lacrimispora saccharolytica]|uniref:Prephenate dehydrogenase n=1 Tax=Lacrimispora saccharolytica (strain ATCC 35040 / DSM 2544 / NRCC 2533 / WM1) TaxID=610130 RepID=D9RAI1_LACSW|nr:prephenate dehydrogenase [Lacrimispora saccharolytica]ADL04259.1 Prephenate dehydrogenase [[Clostridium] saccharolyticum WM1]QRV21462.1 prephenate dehydrogenase [Lacrimispora saccharolytica]
MSDASIAFIGLGLIGGSIARGIKREKPNTKIMAYMRTHSRLLQAKEEGIVDVILDGIGEALRECDLIFLCTPVEYNARYLSEIQPFLKPGAIITDVGSTKADIHEEVRRLRLEGQFVGGHPMAGSEKTGYENSTDHLLENAYYIITPTAASTEEQVNRLVRIANMIGSIPLVLDYHEHDFITATISHLPHIIASSLVNLVKASDNEEGIMKRLAAGGFKDITRIASSSPEMWEQICMTNSGNLSVILERYISSLSQILHELKGNDNQYIYRLFETSRDYRNSFSEKVPGSIAPDYSFTVDMADEVGAISTLSVILAAKGISIKNIGINHNREHGEGTLRIAFYDKETMDSAWKQLERYHYDLISN